MTVPARPTPPRDRGPAPDSLVVRPASLDDPGPLADLLVESFYPWEGWLQWLLPVVRLAVYEDLYRRVRQDPARYACWVAAIAPEAGEAPGTLAGTVELSLRSPPPWDFAGRSYPYLSNLAVRQGWRRRGVARRLLAACEARARQWGFRELYLHVLENNNPARQLYRRAGYRLSTAPVWEAWQWGPPKRLLLRKPLN